MVGIRIYLAPLLNLSPVCGRVLSSFLCDATDLIDLMAGLVDLKTREHQTKGTDVTVFAELAF